MTSSFFMIFNRITFISKLILRNEMLTIEDIDRKWKENPLNEGTSISQKQFQRDRELIRSIYNLDIQPRRLESGIYVYYVKNKDWIKDNSVLKWTMNTLSIAETLASYKSLRHRISLEDYYPGNNLLLVILDAMLNSRYLSITYKRFENKAAKVHSVEPFFIKSYEQRLYLIARINGKRSTCVFALDRILDINKLDSKFKMPDLSVEKFFEDCFGVFRPDDMESEKITIRAYGDEMYYLNTKPLHKSQMAIGLLDLSFRSCDFQLFIKPTLDFIGCLLSRADRIEVLEPKWLRKKLQQSLKKSAKLYSELEELF